jgi:hypothetical protein
MCSYQKCRTEGVNLTTLGDISNLEVSSIDVKINTTPSVLNLFITDGEKVKRATSMAVSCSSMNK